jgi:hypothetical protein
MIYWMYHGASFNLIRYCTLASVFITGSATLWLQGARSDIPQGVWIAFTPFAAAFVAGPLQAVAILVLALAFFFGVIWIKIP